MSGRLSKVSLPTNFPSLIKVANQFSSSLRPRKPQSQKMKRPSARLVTEVNSLPVKSRAGQGIVFLEMRMYGYKQFD